MFEKWYEKLSGAIAVMREVVGEIESGHTSGSEAAKLMSLFTDIERVGAAGRTLAARRVEETNVWQAEGHRTAAGWVAAKTGTSLGQAISVLETARALEELPSTKEAFLAGRLSEVQAKEIAGAADPRTEKSLLETAATHTVGALREICRTTRAASAPDATAAYERIHRSRNLRFWTDAEGALCLAGRLTPDAGARVKATIESRQNRIFAEARKAGRRESPQAYAADALVETAIAADAPAVSNGSSAGPRSGPRSMVHVLVSHEVLATGQIRPGRRCEIPGVGPIPAATAGALAADAVLKAVVTKGSDIHAVVHLGRTIPARIRTALEVRDPVCVVPGCDVRKGLEIDHYRVPFSANGPTKLDNLARLCRWHHYQKTHLGYRLRGGPDAWIWETASDLIGEQGDARPPPARAP